MSNLRRIFSRVFRDILAVSLVLAAAGAAYAEVGAAFQSTALRYRGLYVLRIVDGPDPIFSYPWTPFSTGVQGRSILNPEGDTNGDGPPTLLYNPVSGLPMVAWSRNSASGYDVVLSMWIGGTWTDPEVLAGTAADELDPNLVLDPSDGTVHLFYWVDDGVTWRVMHREAPANLSTWSAPEQVSGAGEPACRPWGVVHEGVLRVAYEVHDFGQNQTPRQVVLARKDAGGFVPEVLAETHEAGKVNPRVHSHAGRLWVDWVDSDTEAAWLRMDASGHWEPTRYEPYSDPVDREFHVRRRIRLQAIR